MEDNADDEALTIRALEKNNIVNELVVAHDGVEALDYLFGFALNVTTDLSYFELIVPCGIDGVQMTSIEKEIGSRDELPVCTVDAAGDIAGTMFGTGFDLVALEIPALQILPANSLLTQILS